MMKKLLFTTAILFVGITLSTNLSAQTTWDGGGDGISWSDPLNWDSDLIPTANDEVVISSASAVEIGYAGAVASSVNVTVNSSLTVLSNGRLIIQDSRRHGLRLRRSTFINSGVVEIINPSRHAITARRSTVTNRSLIEIPSAGLDGIRLNRTDMRNSGTIEIGQAGLSDQVQDGIEFEGNANGSINNWGRILIWGTDSEGIDIDAPIVLTNHAGALISIRDTDDEGFYMDDSGSDLINAGQINVYNGGDEAMEIDGNGSRNETTGIINLFDGDFDIFELDGDFLNSGRIYVEVGPQNPSAVLDIGGGDVFTNDCIIELSGPLPNDNYLEISGTMNNNSLITIMADPAYTGDAIDVEGTLTNSRCGAINISGANAQIEVSGGDLLVNNGIITTEFSGTHTNDGTFTNNGELREPGGTFACAPNAVVGGGSISTGPIPALSPLGAGCPSLSGHLVPTMSEWGLIAFVLLLMGLGLAVVYRRRLAVQIG